MVRAVLIERQTSDCEVKMSYNILVSVEISCIKASIRMENKYNDFIKVMQDSMVNGRLLFIR